MKSGSIFGGSMLIAGTSIGGGMLAMPILMSLGGFYPSIVIYICCWLFMASTGLLFIELCSWMEEDANIVTMAKRTLGKWGEIFAWGLYVFLFYSLILAYYVGCGDLVSQQFSFLTEWTGGLLFVVVAAPLLFVGPRLISPITIWFMLGLGVTYVTFISLGAQEVKPELLTYYNIPLSLIGLPIAFTAFAYQGTVPTLYNFMGRDVRRTRLAVLIGSFIPFIAYVIWQWLILGIVPVYGPHSLNETLQEGGNAVMPLKYWIDDARVVVIGQFFAFFALVTSFFGVALGLQDFLADGLGIKKTVKGKIILIFALFIPPIVISYFIPNLFLTALDYAGGIGCALLLGLLPVLMVWSGRYKMGHNDKVVLRGGKPILVILILFVVFELICEAL